MPILDRGLPIHLRDDVVSERPRCGCRLDHRKQEPKLVAAEPRDEAALANRGDQPRGNFLKQHVANRVTERVVDGLEPIEVEDRDRE